MKGEDVRKEYYKGTAKQKSKLSHPKQGQLVTINKGL